MKVSKTPAKEKAKKEKRKSMVIAAPQADDDDGGSTSSGRKVQKVRSDKGKERTRINKLQLKDGVRRVKVNTKWQILNPEVSVYMFMKLTIIVGGDPC